MRELARHKQSRREVLKATGTGLAFAPAVVSARPTMALSHSGPFMVSSQAAQKIGSAADCMDLSADALLGLVGLTVGAVAALNDIKNSVPLVKNEVNKIIIAETALTQAHLAVIDQLLGPKLPELCNDIDALKDALANIIQGVQNGDPEKALAGLVGLTGIPFDLSETVIDAMASLVESSGLPQAIADTLSVPLRAVEGLFSLLGDAFDALTGELGAC